MTFFNNLGFNSPSLTKEKIRMRMKKRRIMKKRKYKRRRKRSRRREKGNLNGGGDVDDGRGWRGEKGPWTRALCFRFQFFLMHLSFGVFFPWQNEAKVQLRQSRKHLEAAELRRQDTCTRRRTITTAGADERAATWSSSQRTPLSKGSWEKSHRKWEGRVG